MRTIASIYHSRRLLLLLFVALLSPALPTIPVRAAGHCVNPGGTGGCFASIQAAINVSSAGDTITVAAGIYSEFITIGMTLNLNGAGQGATIIQGPNQVNPPTQVFAITAGTVSITGVTIRYVYQSIVNSGNLMVSVSTAGNVVNQRGGTLTLIHDLFNGGVANLGDATITQSTVSGWGDSGVANISPGTITLDGVTLIGNGNPGGTEGGGLYNSGVATVMNSAILGNVAHEGGGVYNRGTAWISNTTISGNSSHSIGGDTPGGDGGGIEDLDTLVLLNVTLSDNIAYRGSGLDVLGPATGPPTSVTVSNSVFVGNDVNCTIKYPGSQVAITSGDYNLSSDASCATIGVNKPHDQQNTDPMLLPLAYNGGPTPTMALQPGSPAIDAIPATGAHCPATDQRGFPRPYGVGCDIGAFESTIPQMAPVPRGGGAPGNGTPSPIPPPRPSNPVSLPPPRTDAPIASVTPNPLPPRR